MGRDGVLRDDFFNSASENTPQILYHCVNKPIRGDCLLPTCHRTVNEQEGTYLFAATHLSKALAFAFDYNKDCPDIIRNGSILDSDDEFAIICKRTTTLRNLPLIHVYAFHSDSFVEAWPGTGSRQFVSCDALPLSKTKLILSTNNPKDLMRYGLQIFSTEKTFFELGDQDFFKHNTATAEEQLLQMVKRKELQWENHAEGINPNSELLRMQSSFSKGLSPP